MGIKYEPQVIEKKWQEKWENQKVDVTIEDPNKPKWYALTMFVYPSGDIHAGHWFAFTPSDAAARWRRMNGYNVFFPVGFDAFGLPAENAAIKRNIHPKSWTYKNISEMRIQLRSMGAMWAWDREAVTCDPEFYKWTQWLFLRLYEAGLAYQDNAPVDWCTSCNTTLAREQVWGDDRHCERCGTPVIKKKLKQWKFRITKYADQLIEGLNSIDWPERVKTMQTNWIGRSDGAEVIFHTEQGDPIKIFTTRPDTLWGATFIVLSPEHPLVDKITTADNKEKVIKYKENAEKMDEIQRTATDKEKTGEFTGGYAVNPVNGERIPIYIADYVLMGYGTGAIMSVPAHDQRDFEFAKKYNLEIRPVLKTREYDSDTLEKAYDSKENGSLINSGIFNGLSVTEAIKNVTQWIEKKKFGKGAVNYRLHDWLISRQRMWGAPIPIIYCNNCGVVQVPYQELPVLLPDDAQFKPTGESPLKSHDDFRIVQCPKCGNIAERETDTMDTFMCSSWYQYAYVSPYHKRGKTIHRDDLPWDKTAGDYWLPVDLYTGGIEHATMHLLYTRFFTKALSDLDIVDFDEPMLRLFNQGMILGPDGEKMSKSRGNVINPDEYVKKYGADTVRGYMMFIGPWDQGGPWNPSAIEGVNRFLHRVWRLVTDTRNAEICASSSNHELISELERKFHQTIISVTEDYEAYRFNTAIAAMMEFNNSLIKAKEKGIAGTPIWNEIICTFIKLIAPIFPHISEELWSILGNTESVHLQSWPKADLNKAKEEKLIIVIQINGKVRSKIEVEPGLKMETIEKMALAAPNVKKWVEDKNVEKVIVVPNKLINIVLE